LERYAVEGATRFAWTISVDARGPGEAALKARRIASRMDIPEGPLRVHAVDQVLRCGEPPASDAGAVLSIEIW
jgi:hypothetical protein